MVAVIVAAHLVVAIGNKELNLIWQLLQPDQKPANILVDLPGELLTEMSIGVDCA